MIGLITARGGSKGVPRKNVRELAGKPMIAWTIEVALASACLDRLIVSTDDAEIAEVARHYGAEVPFMRPAALSQDGSTHIAVALHALDFLRAERGRDPEYLVLLQPTFPLRLPVDIQAAVKLATSRQASAVVGICETHHHPYKAMVIQEDGTLARLIKSDIKYLRRQNLPVAYAEAGAVFVNQAASLRRDESFFPPSSLPYLVPAERALDLDSPWEFYLAELILRDRQRAADRLAALTRAHDEGRP